MQFSGSSARCRQCTAYVYASTHRRQLLHCGITLLHKAHGCHDVCHLASVVRRRAYKQER
jgi:hypothetical protein